MAMHMAKQFATELDRVNCPFYFKIGACRHGDRCSRLHIKPSCSPTLLFSNMYQRPDMITPGIPVDPEKMQEHFEDFYEDIFEEFSKYGEIESLNVCDNVADHMIGNVYVQFTDEDQAANALKNLIGRFYAGRPIIAEFCPVTDFRDATCRQHEEKFCSRGGICNFLHMKRVSRELRSQLFRRYRKRHSRSRSRSRSPYRHRSSQEPHGRRYHSGRYAEDRDYKVSRRRHRSPSVERRRCPSREGSEERRAKIERWNREKEVAEQVDTGSVDNGNGDHYHGQVPLQQN